MQNLFTYSNKNIYIYLKNIYGINKVTSLFICNNIGINPKAKFTDLTTIELTKIQYFISKNYLTQLPLKQKISSNIQNLIILKCYKGKRHFLGLPVRGQRTRTNAKTKKRLGLKFKKIKKLSTLKIKKKKKIIKKKKK